MLKLDVPSDVFFSNISLTFYFHKKRIKLKYEGIAVCLAIRDDVTKPNLGKNQM